MRSPEQASNDVMVVIPARYGSSRFPGKALADVHGKPLVVRTAENASRMNLAGKIIVATDDHRIEQAVVEAGYLCQMTGSHPTGTDRIGEVASRHKGQIILNLQGDEPMLDPKQADQLVDLMLRDKSIDIATCAHPFESNQSWHDANTVKVLVDQSGFALYFSRAPSPGNFPGSEDLGFHRARRHVGIYAFRREALERFLELPPTPLERAEGLEQLRALENGMRIKVMNIDQAPVGVDTPADLEEVRRMWNSRDIT